MDAIPVDAALAAFGKAQFAVTDALRRAQGDALGAIGLNPTECPYRTIASGPYWRLRDYGDRAAPSSLLIVAAPIKRPYIWDLAPSVSAIRHCLRRRLRVYLLEWLPASRATAGYGLDDYAQAIRECIEVAAGEKEGAKPFLIGHSLGGTLAAIFCASAPTLARALVLLGAPLCFAPATSRFRDTLVSLVPNDVSDAEPFPGSLLSQMSALASPATFVWSRLADAALSVGDPHALEVHARVERWALDEAALPGKLVRQIIDWLYRENRFCRGMLPVGDRLVGPGDLSTPTLAVVNTADEVAPAVSVEPFVDALRLAGTDARMIDYPGETGVCLQHLGVLVGRKAHAQVWPEILSWLEARG